LFDVNQSLGAGGIPVETAACSLPKLFAMRAIGVRRRAKESHNSVEAARLINTEKLWFFNGFSKAIR
jgi:hypothetical protein